MLSSTFLPTSSVSEENSLHCSPLQRPAQSVPEGSPQGDTWHWKYWKNQLYCKARMPLPNINIVTCCGGCWCPGAGSGALPQPIPACSWHSQMAPEWPHPWHSPALSPGAENVPSEGQNPTQAERGGSLRRTREWGGGRGGSGRQDRDFSVPCGDRLEQVGVSWRSSDPQRTQAGAGAPDRTAALRREKLRVEQGSKKRSALSPLQCSFCGEADHGKQGRTGRRDCFHFSLTFYYANLF